MALRRLYNLITATANPSYLTNLLPGGAGSQTAGTTANPGLAQPRRETMEQEVLDVTANGTTPTPAAQGALLYEDLTVNSTVAGSSTGATWRQSATANAAIPYGKFGVVMISGQNSTVGNPVSATGGTSQGIKAQVVYDGPCLALCTTNTNQATITPGTLLSADGLGSLQKAPGSPNAGQVLAVAAGSLNWKIATQTLLPVDVGGY